MSVAASSSVSRQASHSLGATSPSFSTANGSVATATMSSLMQRATTAHTTAATGSPNSTSNSLAEEARTKRLARLRTVIEVKLLSWKRNNERLVFFQEGVYIPIKFKKTKEGEEGCNFILVVTANDKHRKVHILILMETTHANGVIDYRLVKPDRNLQRLRVINGGFVHQRISDIIGYDSEDTDSSEEEDTNDGSTVVTRATAKSRIKEADKHKKKKKQKKYIIPEDLSWVRRYPNEFTLVFAKKHDTLHFAVETAQQRSDCLCHLLDVFKEYFGYGFLPTLRNCSDQAVHAVYMNTATAMVTSSSELAPSASMAASFGQHFGAMQRNTSLTTSADELITNTASADHSSGSDRQAFDHGHRIVKFVDTTSGDTLLFISAIEALQRYLFENCFIGGVHSDVKVEYLGKQRRLHRIFLERSPVLRALFDEPNSPHIIKSPPGNSSTDGTTLLLDRVLAEKIDVHIRDSVDCESIDFVLRFLYTNCEVITARSNGNPHQENRLKVIQAILSALQMPIAVAAPKMHSESPTQHSDATTSSSVKNSQSSDENSKNAENREDEEEEEEDEDEEDESDSSDDGTENDAVVVTSDDNEEDGSKPRSKQFTKTKKTRATTMGNWNHKTISKVTNAIARRMTRQLNFNNATSQQAAAATTTTMASEHLATTVLSENSSRLMVIIVVETMTILVLVFVFVLTQIATLFK